MDLTPMLGALAVIIGSAVLWWTVSGGRPSQATTNLMAGLDDRPPDVRAMLLAQSARERVGVPLRERLAALARRVTPAGRLDALNKRLLQAGNPRGMDLTQILTAKVAFGLAGLVVGALRFVAQPGASALVVALGLALGGYFLPDALLSSARSRRFDTARTEVADIIDQLTVTVEAGLGLDAAMAQVARANTGPLAEELSRTLQDVQAGVPRSRALKEMAERLDVPEVRQVVFAIVESEKHGIPIAGTLRVQADDLRVRRRQRAEEKAMKLPVKIVFPTILCIMPALFIVVLGPAAIRIFTTLGGH